MSKWTMQKPAIEGPIHCPIATIRFESESDLVEMAFMNRRGERVLKLADPKPRDIDVIVAEFSQLPEVHLLSAGRTAVTEAKFHLARVEATARVARKSADARRRQLLELGKASAEHLADLFGCTQDAVDRAERDAKIAEAAVAAARRAASVAEQQLVKLYARADIATATAARREEEAPQRELLRQQLEVEDEIRRTLDPLMKRWVDLHFARQVVHPDGKPRRIEIVSRVIGPMPDTPSVVEPEPPSAPAAVDVVEPAPRKSFIGRVQDAIFAGSE